MAGPGAGNRTGAGAGVPSGAGAGTTLNTLRRSCDSAPPPPSPIPSLTMKTLSANNGR